MNTIPPASTARRWLLAAGAGALLPVLAGLAACGTPAPPTHWYALRSEAPEPPASPAGVGAADDGADIWEISPRVPLPGALERDTLVRASGAAGLELLTGHRWAEPLRDAVPRLLLHDLAQLRGGARVWAAPAPPGVAVARRLRVELLALQAAADGRSLNLQAQWWLQETGTPASPPRKGQLTLQLPLADAGVDTLAAAHRLALWRLAVQIARTAATAPP